MTTTRWAALALVSVAVIASVARFLSGAPSIEVLVRVVVQTLIFLPLKGALLRFLGGSRPYRSALAATSSSELVGMGFPLSGLGVPWPELAASLVLSTGFEGLTLVAMGTARVRQSFGMALYMNFFVHLLVAGIILCWPEVLAIGPTGEPSRLLGSTIIFLSFLIFILPIFLVSRPLSAKR
jgi:hypothetical protein